MQKLGASQREGYPLAAESVPAVIGARHVLCLAALIAAALMALALAPVALAKDSVYWGNWTSGTTISYAALDNTGGADLGTAGATVLSPYGVAIDPAAGKIYWANFGSSIGWANLDGTGGGDLATTGATISNPIGLAIDPAAGKIYWASMSASKISWANLDNTGGGDLATTGATVSAPIGLAIDPDAGKIYWVNQGLNTIFSANLDGTGGGAEIDTTGATVDSPWGLAIDPAAGKIYWANLSAKMISSANLDGTGGGADLVNTGADENRPYGIAIDPAAGKLYWAALSAGEIFSANLDGTGGGASLDTTGAASTPFTYISPAFPALLQAPLGSGSPRISEGVDGELSCSEGSWASDLLGAFLYRAPASLAYQWLRDDAEIAGETEQTFTLTEKGSYSCRVSAINHAGSSAQTSAALELPSLSAKGKQKAKYLKLHIGCGVSCSAKIKGKAIAPGKNSGKAATALFKRYFNLKKKTVQIEAGQTKTVKLKFKKQKKWTKRISQIQNRHKVARKRSKVLVKVKATTLSGTTVSAKQKIKLKG